MTPAQVAHIMSLVDDHAAARAEAFVQYLHGTSKSYAKQCDDEAAQSRAAVEAALLAPQAEAVGAWKNHDTAKLVNELRDELASRVAEMEADARRYKWLKERLLGADWEWGDPATNVWVFETDTPISADLDESIDAAIATKGGKL